MRLTKKQRGMIILPLLVVGLLVGSYVFFIPRTQVNTATVYHQSFSGTSVQSKVENAGTKDIVNLRVNLSVIRNEDEVLVDWEEELVKLMEPRNNLKLGFTFTGPQIKTYTIRLTLDFESEGLEYNESFEYQIEDYMNGNWEDKVVDWRI